MLMLELVYEVLGSAGTAEDVTITGCLRTLPVKSESISSENSQVHGEKRCKHPSSPSHTYTRTHGYTHTQPNKRAGIYAAFMKYQ